MTKINKFIKKNKSEKYTWDMLAVLLLIIILFGTGIRLYQLDKIPPGIFTDEAADGYEAYSILKTMHDSHNKFLPILINHHDGYDFTESAYVYFSIPFIYLFDLTVFSTRLLAALIGSITILTTYLLTRELFNKKIGITAALFIALSPWHFHLSRIAFRNIFIPLVTTISLYFLLKGLKKPKLFIISGAILGFSLHTYSIMKLATPLILAVFTIFYFQKINIKKNLKYMFISILIFAIISFPIYYLSLAGEGNKRFDYTSIFTKPEPLRLFIQNVLKHISPTFLFIEGDLNLRHNISGFGQILLTLMPFVIIGLILGGLNKNKNLLFLLSLFLIGISVASLTYEGIPHALRSFSAVPFLEIIAAYGAVKTYEKINKNILKKCFVIIISILFVLNASYYLHSYFVKYPTISQGWWEYGWEEAINYAEKNSEKYEKIIVHTNWPNEIFIKFFAKINPSDLQKTRKLGKYEVCYDDKFSCYKEGKNLYIVKPNELMNKKILHQIYDYNKNAVLKIVE